MQIKINFLCIAVYSLNSTDTVNLQSMNLTTMALFESNKQQSVNKQKFSCHHDKLALLAKQQLKFGVKKPADTHSPIIESYVQFVPPFGVKIKTRALDTYRLRPFSKISREKIRPFLLH